MAESSSGGRAGYDAFSRMVSLRVTLAQAGGLAVLLALTVLGGASAQRAAAGYVNWLDFGNTPDEIRYSPLAQITPSNASQLGRLFTFDLNKVVPGIKKGQQSYPIVHDGTIYVTSGDDQVFAVNGVTGAMLWHYAPSNLATFKNYGIVANRGVTWCDGKLYLLTLDMTIVELDPATGNQLARVAIGHALPGAYSNYGYSETSAPICASHLVVIGAAGSDYGVRGFVMAYHTDLTPAWANPFWTIPPAGTEWRSAAPLVGGGTNWTPETVDPTTNTLYFGTAAASPSYYPSLRPGSDPRCDSLIAVDLATGKLKWWQQQIAFNEWGYDTSQPPMVYTAKIGGKSRRIVSVATMEGMWYAYDAKTGQPIYQRVKVIDNVEHPNLVPGKPVAVYPSSLGGLNYSPASYDPQTNEVYNAAAETGSALEQQTPAQEKRQELLLGNTFLGLANGDFGTYLQTGWKDYGSVSAIDVGSGKQVWKFQTPQPERGGVTTTAGGVGFVGGGDGNMRAFDVKTGKVLWTFQTGYQIASGPTVYGVDGTEYVAITVGGTTTSSNGGTVASQLQVFALGGSQTQSPGPTFAPRRAAAALPARVGSARAAAARPVAPARSAGSARIAIPGPVMVEPWDPNSSNTSDVQGRVTLAGKPVAGARVSVNGWVAPPTDANGTFVYPADDTMPGRHVVKVVDAADATVGGRKLGAGEQSELLAAKSGISVGYAIADLSTKLGPGGTVVVDGRLTYGKDLAPLPVELFSYELTGTIRRVRQPGQGRDRHHPDRRPQVLDVLRTDRGERQVHLVPRRRRPGGRRPGADGGRRLGRGERVDRAGGRLDRLRGAEERHPRHPAPRRERRDADEEPAQPAADGGRDLPRAARRGRRARGRDPAAERAVAGRARALRARAPGLGAGPHRQVLGGGAPVLHHLVAEARGAGRPLGLPEVARRGRAAGDRDRAPARVAALSRPGTRSARGCGGRGEAVRRRRRAACSRRATGRR